MDEFGVSIAILLVFLAAIGGIFVGNSAWFDRFMKAIGDYLSERP